MQILSKERLRLDNMGITRVSKKLVPALWDIDAAIIMCNAFFLDENVEEKT